MAASMAKLERVSCRLAHENESRTRGAASPRSASPIGPAPTRLPRIALPLPTDELLARSPRARRGENHCHVRRRTSGFEKQAERDDADEPDHARDDGETVEVPLDHGGPTERR